jgi:uncharacterized BrkB/YihY/UPF0761 family membrane protein
VIATLLSDLRDYLREYWRHASRSFGRKALMASIWFVGMFAPLGLKTIISLPQWAAVTWMIGWAGLGYLFAPFGMWKAQRKKIEEMQNRDEAPRTSK